MNHPLSLNDVKCRISEGCFFALGSFSRFKLEQVNGQNDAGTDFRLIKQMKRNGKVCDLGSVLDFQLKSTSTWTKKGQTIKYKLASKNFNDIVTRNIEGGIPLILIVMCLPEKTNHWLSIQSEALKFNSHFFWYHTESTKYLENENSKKTISIPVTNLLTKLTLQSIISKYSTQPI